MSRPVSDCIRRLKIFAVGITQGREQDLPHTEKESRCRGRILYRAEEFDQRVVRTLLFQEAAGKSQLEHSIPQGVGSFSALPDKTRQASLDFERSDSRDPRRLAHQQRALAKEKALEKLCRVEAHPARPRLRTRQELGRL